MSAKHVLSVSLLVAVLAAGASGAVAASEVGTITRADMKALVLEARADGELQPAGEAANRFDMATRTSTLTRRQVRDDTLVARALGQLMPAGQGAAQVVPTGSQFARADVRDGVRQANLSGELARAGEAMSPVEHAARAHLSRAEIVAMRTRR
jgi:hypothetical protein